MSKKTKAKAQARATRRATISAERSSASSRSAARGSRSNMAAAGNVLPLRIAAAVLAVAALAGGIYWSQSIGNNFNVPVILGLLALGFVAGLSMFAALRPEVVLKRLFTITRR